MEIVSIIFPESEVRFSWEDCINECKTKLGELLTRESHKMYLVCYLTNLILCIIRFNTLHRYHAEHKCPDYKKLMSNFERNFHF